MSTKTDRTPRQAPLTPPQKRMLRDLYSIQAYNDPAPHFKREVGGREFYDLVFGGHRNTAGALERRGLIEIGVYDPSRYLLRSPNHYVYRLTQLGLHTAAQLDA